MSNAAEKVETIKVTGRDAGQRLDRWFRQHFPTVSQGFLQKLLRTGQVRVDSKRAEANLRLEAGQQVRVPKLIREAPPMKAATGQPAKPQPAASKADRELIRSMILY